MQRRKFPGKIFHRFTDDLKRSDRDTPSFFDVQKIGQIALHRISSPAICGLMPASVSRSTFLSSEGFFQMICKFHVISDILFPGLKRNQNIHILCLRVFAAGYRTKDVDRCNSKRFRKDGKLPLEFCKNVFFDAVIGLHGTALFGYLYVRGREL